MARSDAPAASDRLAPKRSARPAARQRPRPDARTCGVEVSQCPSLNAGDATLHSALMLAPRITFAHLAVSDLMTTANSSGELRDTSRPSCAIRSRTSACTAICAMSACTLLTTAAGVPAGANSPNQEMALEVRKA